MALVVGLAVLSRERRVYQGRLNGTPATNVRKVLADVKQASRDAVWADLDGASLGDPTLGTRRRLAPYEAISTLEEEAVIQR